MNRRRRVPIYLTEAQHEALQRLAERSTHRSVAGLVRQLLSDYAKTHEIDWPEGEYAWGGARRGHNHKQELPDDAA